MACFRWFKTVSKSFTFPLIILTVNAFIAFLTMVSDLVEPEVKVAQKVAQKKQEDDAVLFFYALFFSCKH